MKVEVVETTLVAPSEETPRHALWLSNLDLAVPKTHTPLVYYYPAPAGAAGGSPDSGGDGEGKEGFFAPERLREALASALVPFYPLAGRLAVGPGGRIEIDCNGEGALFVVARADFTGDEMFKDFEPSPEARRLLVPFAASGDPPCVLAMVQSTIAFLSFVREGPSACWRWRRSLAQSSSTCRQPFKKSIYHQLSAGPTSLDASRRRLKLRAARSGISDL